MTPGTRIGPYEVIAPLGAGGMGEVYRARDAKLGRDVALKILPDAFAGDPERFARFEREAKTLAALNHPHIAHIYGFEQSGSISALVMELVEGEDLDVRITREAIPLDEALPIARQIAEALEAAHEHGIIHRDLKPANIKVRPDGTVKVLDFGLAKALIESGGPGADVLESAPTITSPAAMTATGIILGTAAYMSPEQAKGKAVDKRADIWAFGSVLYEMLAGHKAFFGEDVTDTIVAVMSKEPDWSALPEATPLTIRRLLRRCLTKNAHERLPHIGVARLDIDEVLEPGLLDIASPWAQTSRQREKLLPWGVAGAALVAAATVFMLWSPWRAATPASPLQVTAELRPDVTLTSGQGRASSVIVSPDGSVLAFVALTDGNPLRLFVRPFSQPQATALAGTDGAVNPFFSPDGQWIAFFADGKLKKVSVNGGPVATLCDAPSNRGGDWSEDGTIVFAPDRSGSSLARVSEAGGNPLPVTTLTEGDTTHRWPQVLPGARAVLYTAHTNPIGFDTGRIVVQELPSGARKTVVRDGYYGRYLPSGHIVYVHEGTVFAAAFNLERLEVAGAAFPIIENVANNSASGGAEIAFSATGTFVYVPGRTAMGAFPIVWMDRQRRFTPLRAEPAIWSDARIAPDGPRLAMAVLDRGQFDVWVYDWTTDRMQRLTVAAGNNDGPVWTPDGRRIVFASSRGRTSGTDLYWQQADLTGEAQRLTDSDTQKRPDSWHPSGKFLLYTEIGKTSTDLMMLSFDGDEVGVETGETDAVLK